MSDMLGIQLTATKPCEPAVSPTRKVVDMQEAQRALDDWLKTLGARDDKQLSMKPPPLSTVAKPWQTLAILRRNVTSFTKTSLRIPNFHVDKTML